MTVYVTQSYVDRGVDPDSGQALVEVVGCTRFQCQKWCQGMPVVPHLVTNDEGFRVCPVCGGSYGKAPQ